jgi:hypothetical protein
VRITKAWKDGGSYLELAVSRKDRTNPCSAQFSERYTGPRLWSYVAASFRLRRRRQAAVAAEIPATTSSVIGTIRKPSVS